MGWAVVETNPQAECCVRDQIEEKELPVFLPMARRRKRSHHRRASDLVPLLSRYLFVHFDPVIHKLVWPDIVRLRGVKTLLGLAENRGIPSFVKDIDIERLRAIADAKSVELPIVLSNRLPIPRGTIVRVLWGPMMGDPYRVEIDKGNRVDVILAAAGVIRNPLPISLPKELVEAVA